MDERKGERRKKPFQHHTTYELVVEVIRRMGLKDTALVSDRQLRILRNEAMNALDKRHLAMSANATFKG